MLSNQFLKTKNGLLEPEKNFMELKDRELKDGEELFYKAIIVSKDGMDNFKMFQSVLERKPKIIKNKLKDKIIIDIWTLFEPEEEKKKKEKKRSIMKEYLRIE